MNENILFHLFGRFNDLVISENLKDGVINSVIEER